MLFFLTKYEKFDISNSVYEHIFLNNAKYVYLVLFEWFARWEVCCLTAAFFMVCYFQGLSKTVHIIKKFILSLC